MDAYFVEMLGRLKLTKRQRDDAIAKYTGVAKTLHAEFYGGEYNDSCKLLIGSYGKRTHIRPPGDIDLLFKIPLETFKQYSGHSGNGQAALLQKVRDVLGKKYITTEKIAAWGKVVLVEFSDGTHNVEVLPGYEINGVFKIPNSENGGSWEDFDARNEINLIVDSHARTGGKTRKLIRMIKRWRKENATMTIKAYEIERYCVQFLDAQPHEGKTWSELVAAFFIWLSDVTYNDTTFIATARVRAIKARAYELTDKVDKACEEWSKVFGTAFPAYSQSLNNVYTLTKQFPSLSERGATNSRLESALLP
jgi:Second Messenger Oligonucleotide or Dinucleotide Synthetase domain